MKIPSSSARPEAAGLVGVDFNDSEDRERIIEVINEYNTLTDLAVISEKSDSGSKNQKSNSQKRYSVNQFIASSGKQSIATMLKKPLEHVQKHPEYLHEALTGWVRVPGVTGEYLDHRAAWKAIDDSRGRTGRMRGVPGAKIVGANG